MARVLSISNLKGGSGKTTTVVNLSAALALKGRKVLVIDADPQAHTTWSLGVHQKAIREDLYSVLMQGKDAAGSVLPLSTPGLHLIPASRRLAVFERDFSRDKEARTRLVSVVQNLRGPFDYVVFDTPPTLSLLTIACLVASEEVYVPMQAHVLGMKGLADAVRLLYRINRLYNPRLMLKGVIPTFYAERTRLSIAVMGEVKKRLGEDIVLHPVRSNISLAEAPQYGKDIFAYDGKSSGAADYMLLAEQIEGLK